MNKTRFVTGTLLLALTFPALALAQPNTSGLAPGLAEFMDVPGFESVDVANIEDLVDASLPETDSVFRASGQLSPLAKTVQVVNAVDGELSRTRQQLSVSVIRVPEPPAADPVPFVLITIDRYNLGPSIRADLVQGIGEEHVAPPAEFGEGPHVSWRLVMRPMMGSQAVLVAASRMEIQPEIADGLDCLGTECLSLASGIEELASWSELEDSQLSSGQSPLETAVMVDVLTELAFFDAYSHEAGFDATDEPITVAHVLLESNLGQDLATDGALRVGELRDDSLGAIWQRAVAFHSGERVMLLQGQAYECRRGVSDEGLCL